MPPPSTKCFDGTGGKPDRSRMPRLKAHSSLVRLRSLQQWVTAIVGLSWLPTSLIAKESDPNRPRSLRSEAGRREKLSVGSMIGRKPTSERKNGGTPTRLTVMGFGRGLSAICCLPPGFSKLVCLCTSTRATWSRRQLSSPEDGLRKRL